MAYQIDFTAAEWSWRARRKLLLRLGLCATVAGIAWGAHDVYTTFNEPTLNMRLAEYEAVTHPIEEMNVAWDKAAKEYNAMHRYYRLLWAANPTNFLSAMASADAPQLKRGFRPAGWSLTTGGDCRLDYRYVFDAGDKAAQTKGLEALIVNAVTSVVKVANGKVDVQGVLHENLLNLNELNVAVRFSLPDVRSFPTKEKTITDCVAEIAAMRKKVQESKFLDESEAKGAPATAQRLMMEYLTIGKDKPGFPELANVIDVAGWLKRADEFIWKNKIPGDEAGRKRLKEAWNGTVDARYPWDAFGVGNARYPWDRFRLLDNEELVLRTKALGSVSDGVKRFKGFLEQHHADRQKKLEPFVDCYEHNDIFNKPFVESDLKDRVARKAGITQANVTFKDVAGVEPSVLDRDDEKFTFTWVRWTLTVGSSMGRDGVREQQAETAATAEPLTLVRLADCTRRALELGPGYALDKIKVDFGADGNVTGAVLEGLLPVKRVEAKKGKSAKEAGK